MMYLFLNGRKKNDTPTGQQKTKTKIFIFENQHLIATHSHSKNIQQHTAQHNRSISKYNLAWVNLQYLIPHLSPNTPHH